MFYNPMWGRFGDESVGPPGTYYYSSSDNLSYFWNIFDQVLIRPVLMPFFNEERMKVLTRVGDKSLLTTNGLPDADAVSDHLPLVFRLDLPVI